MRSYRIQSLILAAFAPTTVLALPALAQPMDVSQFISNRTDSARTGNPESNIVISVRNFSAKDDLCGSGFRFSLPRPSSFGDAEFPHAGRTIGINNFPHPGRIITTFPGSSTTYFQLPAGAADPDIVGCVDPQQNTVFITIKPPRPLQSSTLPSPRSESPPIQFPQIDRPIRTDSLTPYFLPQPNVPTSAQSPNVEPIR